MSEDSFTKYAVFNFSLCDRYFSVTRAAFVPANEPIAANVVISLSQLWGL